MKKSTKRVRPTKIDRTLVYVFFRGSVTGREVEAALGKTARHYVTCANFGYNAAPDAARRYGLGQTVPSNKRPGLFKRLDDRRQRRGVYELNPNETTMVWLRRAMQRLSIGGAS